MKESIRYRNTPKGIEFCHYEIQKDSYQNNPVYTIEYSHGSIGSIPDCDAVIDQNIELIEEIESSLLIEYPVEYISMDLYQLELNLTDYKKDITSALLGQLSRSIQWNIKHSGLGFTKVKLRRKDKILSTRLRLNSNRNLHKILSFDLGPMGIKPNQIKIY
ncbi:hypothetical protein OAP32_00345 [Crocinitomicaceae bacterium]|nr:hypothetical protein [Crocinitomicaceae bacterium]